MSVFPANYFDNSMYPSPGYSTQSTRCIYEIYHHHLYFHHLNWLMNYLILEPALQHRMATEILVCQQHCCLIIYVCQHVS